MSAPERDDRPAAGGQGEPTLRVLRGRPSPEELAALLTVLFARGRAEPAARRPSWWARPTLPTPTGAGAWRASALPR